MVDDLPHILVVDDEPGVMLADVDGRLGRALALVFEGCAKALAGKGDVLAVDVHVEPTRVRLAVDAIPGEGFVEAILTPIAGNAAEHWSAVYFAAKNRLNVSIGIAVGSIAAT